MPEQLANDYSTPQTEAQTTPQVLPRGDISYFTQEMANVNAAITEMRLQMQTGESNLSGKIDRALDNFSKLHLDVKTDAKTLSTELKADIRVLSAEVKGELKAVDATVKALNTSISEIKPKVDNLTNWGRVIIGFSIAIGVVFTLYKNGIIKLPI